MEFQGLQLFVESDSKGIWWLAKGWQKKKFKDAMRLDEMKSMGWPNPIEITTEFKKDGFTYQFEILNDWGPVFLINTTTNKKRQLRYIDLDNGRSG